jgi:hypothetical protein
MGTLLPLARRAWQRRLRLGIFIRCTLVPIRLNLATPLLPPCRPRRVRVDGSGHRWGIQHFDSNSPDLRATTGITTVA